jgi:predicted dienelactone hydrolase
VGVTTVELADTSRPTEPNREYPGDDKRTLVVEIWYPAEGEATADELRDAPLAVEDAPYPLIVFAHGLSGTRRQSVSYTQHLASHGYVVAAPDFPLSNGGAPGGPRIAAVINQPEDVSFVIDEMLGFDAEEGNLFEGAIDEERIGLTGHSLGALTTFVTTYGPKRDERIDASLPISVVGCLFSDDIAGDATVPLLLLVGTDDLITPAKGTERAYALANAPKYAVLIDGADHVRFADVDLADRDFITEIAGVIERAGFGTDPAQVVSAFGGGDFSTCVGGEDDGSPLLTGAEQRERLRAFATPFFAAYLRDDEGAASFLQEDLPALLPEAQVTFDVE